MADVTVEMPDYQKMYEDICKEIDIQNKFIALLIEKLGGKVTFKNTDFIREVLEDGNFIITVTEDREYNSRTYTMRRV